MKTKAVIFFKRTAKVVINPPNLIQLSKLDNVLINPDLTLVRKIPPHFWKQVGDSVVSMTRPEKLERLAEIEQFGVDEDTQDKGAYLLHAAIKEKRNIWKYLFIIETILSLLTIYLYRGNL